MTLIKCSECNKDVSTLAQNCPNCGAPILKEKIEKNDEEFSTPAPTALPKSDEVEKVEEQEVEEQSTTEEVEENNLPKETSSPVTITRTSAPKITKKSLITISLVLSFVILIIVGISTKGFGLLNLNKDETKTAYIEPNKDNLNQIKVVKAAINLRETTSPDSKVIGKIYAGDTYNIQEIVYLNEENKIAYEIKYNNKKAYIITDESETEIKLIINNDDYKSLKDLNEEQINNILRETLLNNGYTISPTEDNVYIQNGSSTSTINSSTTYNMNEKTYNFYYSNNGSSMIIIYYYLYDRVEYIYMTDNIDSTYYLYSYNTKTKEGTCTDRIDGLLCKEVDTNGNVIPLINSTISKFNSILTESNLTLEDLK